MTAEPKKRFNKEEVQRLIGLNPDARQYFFTKADDKWLDWLWKNGFLDVIKQKAEDPTLYKYQLPELDYLVKVAATKPKEVVDIMLSVDVPNNFNPEVVDRFLWICTNLQEADQLARMVTKIHDEQWVQRMGGHTHWTFEYQKMFDTLVAAGDHASILTLAEAVLAVRTKDELGKKGTRSTDQPFYFDDLSQTGVFQHLLDIDDAHAEAAFALLTKTFGEIVLLGGEKEDDVFPIGEIFALFDVDFFTAEGGRENGYSPREEVKDLAATMRKLAERLVGRRCDATDTVRRFYEEYIVPLPDAGTIWRFRLFFLSLCPQVFKQDLKNAFFRIFEVGDRIWPIAGGAEYETALQRGFGALEDKDQREYFRRSLELYADEDFRQFGFDIVSSAYAGLTPEERQEAQRFFGKPLNADHVPQPSGGQTHSGFISPRVPPGSDAEWEQPVPKIVELLKTAWTPKALRELDTERNFLNPISAEGIADRMKIEIKKRFPEYLGYANLFFDPENLDAHYTYSFVRGIEEALKTEKTADLNWEPLMGLFAAIMASSKQEAFTHGARRKEDSYGWLSGWDGVHNGLADLVKNLLGGSEDGIIPFQANRQALLDMITYLLEYPDPLPEDHEVKKNPITGEEQYIRSDPFTEAINSVRGRTIQSLTIFVYRDSKKFDKDAPSKLSPDVKRLYEAVLSKENTEAMMFMFGHCVQDFYFRDKDWMRPLVPRIFPMELEKKDLLLASAEGYLTSMLYKELFEEFAPLYKHLISLTPDQYTKRRYFSNIDEALATHIALAYMHFDNFDTNSDLFKGFWWSEVPQRRKEFVSFVGRHAISRDNAKEWCEANGVSIQKLPPLWDWILENCNDPEPFAQFGFWINAEKGVFDVAWLADHVKQTLQKSKGTLDWELGMMKSLPLFVQVAPQDALAILKYYLESMLAGGNKRRGWMYIDSELVAIFKELYRSPDTEIKRQTYDFINSLVRRGGTHYWPLKAAIE